MATEGSQQRVFMCSISVPVDTKDLCEAAGQAIRLVRSAADDLEGVGVRLFLNVGSNLGVIRRLAERLPGDARGFQGDAKDHPCHSGGISAEEFLRVTPSEKVGPSVFDCFLTDRISAEDALRTVEDMLRAKPGAIRSTALDLDVTELRLRGAPDEARASVSLNDMKWFKRKRRFHMSVGMLVVGKGRRDPAVKAALAAAEEATGLPFKKARLTEHELPTPEDEARQESMTPEQDLAVSLCLTEAVEQAAREIDRVGVSFAGLPGLASRMESFYKRMESRILGKKERVNFASILKRFMRERHAAFKCTERDAEYLVFSRQLDEELDLGLCFDKLHFYGLGKAFELKLLIDVAGGPNEGWRWSGTFFRLFHIQVLPPCWSYTTKDELLKCLNGLSGLLEQVLPIVESCAVKWLSPAPLTLPDTILSRAPFTAAEGIEQARDIARNLAGDAHLYRLASGFSIGSLRKPQEPCLSADGRMTTYGCWSYYFYSIAADRTLLVELPGLGRPRHYYVPEPEGSIIPAKYRYLPLGDGWLDSDKVMAVADTEAERLSREEGVEFSVSHVQLALPEDQFAQARRIPEEELQKMPEDDLGVLLEFRNSLDPECDTSCPRWDVYVASGPQEFSTYRTATISFRATDGANLKVVTS